MTLSVVAKHPNYFFRNFPVPLEQAALFCCDSRISNGGGHEDICNKLFPITVNSAIVCAGDARSHYLAIFLLMQRVNRTDVATVDFILSTISDCYRESIARAHPRDTLKGFIGIFDHDSFRVRIFKLNGHIIEEILDPELHCVGPNEDDIQTYEFAYEYHIGELTKPGSNQFPSYDAPNKWLHAMVVPFEKLFRKDKINQNVGGIVQAGFLTSKGFFWLNRATLLGQNDTMTVIETIVRETENWNEYSVGELKESTFSLEEMLKRLGLS